MRKISRLAVAVLALAMLPNVCFSQQQVRWEPTLDGALRLAGQTNRLVLIEFWGSECVFCKRLDAEVLANPAVVAAINADYIAVRVNADHFPATAKRYGVSALPTTVIAQPDGRPLSVMRGFVDAARYTDALGRVAADVKQRRTATYAQVPATASQPSIAQASPPAGAPIANLAPPPSASTAVAQPVAPAPAYAQPAQPVSPPPAPPIYGQYGQAAPPAVPSPNYGQTAPPVAPPTNYGYSPMPNNAPVVQPTAMPALPSRQIAPGNPPLGLDGYCPVSLCEKKQWAQGDRRWGAIHRGRTYLFTGPEEQRRFLTDPDRYAPVVSGNDVVLAVEQGQAVPGMREHGVFFGNRIYLFADEASLAKFAKNPSAYASQTAEAHRSGSLPNQPVR